MTYPKALPHDPPKQIADDVFVVYGKIKANAVISFTRNMTIVRDNGELTLINPVRMNDENLAELEELGEVKHVLRLGAFHGIDDPFYVDRYNTEFWSFEGGETYTQPTISKVLSEGCELPFSRAKLFSFKHIHQPEGAILLERSPNLLLACDAIQSYSTPPHMLYTNWITRLLMRRLGFTNVTLIGPLWTKAQASDKEGLKAEFERLMQWDFDQLLAAHGTFLSHGAHDEVKQAFKTMYEQD